MEHSKKKLKLRDCPICGGSQNKLFVQTQDFFNTQEVFDLVSCDQCQFVYTNPIPNTKDLIHYYDSEDYLSHQPERKSIRNFLYKQIKGINIKRKYDLVKTYGDVNSVLEIGTGTGELLNYFSKKGLQTVGIEPNETARNYAVNKLHLDVFEETKIDTLENASFDVIMMWHVLEHVYNLNERIDQVKRLLKHKGKIVIAIPNLDAPDYKKYKKYWAALDVPRHLYHFNEQSLKKLLEKHSLQLISKHPMKFDAYYISLLSEKYKGNRFPYFAALLNGFKSNRKAKRNNNYSSMIFVASDN